MITFACIYFLVPQTVEARADVFAADDQLALLARNGWVSFSMREACGSPALRRDSCGAEYGVDGYLVNSFADTRRSAQADVYDARLSVACSTSSGFR